MSTEDATTFGIRGGGHDYSGVVVLRDVDFELRSGEVHALIGENGSGKSTLIKVLTGVVKARRGELRLDDRQVRFHTPQDAKRHGVGVVHQDYHLFPEMTVADNVFGVGKGLPRHRLWPGVDHGAVRRRVAEMLGELGIDVSPRALVRQLGPAERKFVEVARAMLDRPRFLILDEPTASLEPNAARRVLELLDRLRSHGVGLAFVSHRLDEILQIADRVSVLRDGRLVTRIERAAATEEVLVGEMMGDEARRERAPRTRPATADGGPPALAVRDLVVRPGARPVAFALAQGEILGLTGLLGAGPATVVHMLGGARPARGRVEVMGRAVGIRSPRDSTRAGIGFIPEDRKAEGLVLGHSIADNIAMASLPDVSRLGFVSHAEIRARAERYRELLRIRCRDVGAPVATLSGGNQQKVLIAKWLASGVRILVVEEPTHGVDIKGKGQIHDLLREFAAQGGSVLVASTDVHEIVELCDRIAIFRHGSLTEVLATTDLTGSDVAVKGLAGEHLLEQLVEGETTTEAA
ncbi:MAG TPA: sugar ABC transporter ATP-binding protein [Conexibacter sp.]|nr:sugar ABC transporter ATP-binding protein [Conexibacter sp.]